MNTKLAAAAMAVLIAGPAMVPPALAQTHRTYHGRTHYRCKKSSGTTGLVAGGVGGALVGNALGGGLVGTALGAGGGALLGRPLDKNHDAAQNRRHGC